MVLDLVDNNILLDEPMKRLSAEDVCTELLRISKAAEDAQSKLGEQIPDMITEALCQLDDSVPKRAPPKTSSEKAAPDSHSRNVDSTRLEIPPKNTTHRSDSSKLEEFDPTTPLTGNITPKHQSILY